MIDVSNHVIYKISHLFLTELINNRTSTKKKENNISVLFLLFELTGCVCACLSRYIQTCSSFKKEN